MKIAYNPKTAAALTTAPANNDITFDLRGLNIFVRGEKFKGTDTTYSVFKKHTSAGSGGYNGLVPVPSYTATNIRFLREDGTWSIPAAAAFIYTQLTNQDLDDYLDEGKWYYADGGNSVTNKPSGVDAFELYVGRNASGYRYQKLITSSGIIWFRYYDSTAWKTWVRWYTDQNTDQKVLQSATTTANFRPVILGYTNTNTPSDLSANVTQQVYTTTTIYAQPSTGSLWANKLYSGGKPVLTEHQSLANYVTLNTSQTITGTKTFGSNIQFNGTQSIHWNNGTYQQRISITNDSTANTSVFNFQQSTNTGTSWNNILQIYDNGILHANGYYKNGSSDSYVLLGGGGHKLVSDFMLKTDELSNNLTTITKSLNVTQAWMDTGITSTNLPANGTYIVQVQVNANDSTGTMYNCYSSGVMSWYKDGTNDTETDEIILHRSGHAYGKTIYLRTVMQSSGVLKLQIGASSGIGKAYTYTFKFKRII